MAERPAEVTNAANPDQVRGSRRRSQRREVRFLDALREVMRTPAGRLVFGERDRGLLARCGIYTSPLHAAGSMLYYNVGRQDMGREILAQLLAAGEDEYQLMEKEMRALAVRDDNETRGNNAAASKDAEE
jgi:hypothetical protein